ncbi:hypothetical protein IVB03_39525 [Bradyrhizobium sp. 168]|uniref:hypothetical protein n=1 Tax=Bradyrhizobium sp. 168 TaxID=2782639 RepID=UPI001FF832DE|nr:hypothetical protein [Bradyrhizobium sp. 168]MCK1585487.1 hypothetical protein [Bradyrhizobium sp. 168]
MTFNPLIFRNNRDGIGAPGDDVAANATDPNTLVSLAKKMVSLLSGTIAVAIPAGAATAANQTTQTASLNSIDGHVDGLETLVAATNTALAAATPAGSNLIGRIVSDASAATGGISSTARLASAAASTNATNVKITAGRIYQASGRNNASYDVFLVLYDSATNPPVPGTTTIRKKMVVPAGQAFVYDWPVGLTFATGIGYAFTKLVADADTTALVAADITAFNLDYV